MNGLGQLGQLGRTSDAERPSCNLAKISLLLWTRPNRPDFRGRAADCRPTQPARPDFRGRATELQHGKNIALAVDPANAANSEWYEFALSSEIVVEKFVQLLVRVLSVGGSWYEFRLEFRQG